MMKWNPIYNGFQVKKGRTAETVRPTPEHRLTLNYPYEKQRKECFFMVDLKRFDSRERFARSAAVLTVHRTVIHYRAASNLFLLADTIKKAPARERLRNEVVSPFGFCNQPE